jgi:hypothetical protein
MDHSDSTQPIVTVLSPPSLPGPSLSHEAKYSPVESVHRSYEISRHESDSHREQEKKLDDSATDGEPTPKRKRGRPPKISMLLAKSDREGRTYGDGPNSDLKMVRILLL